MTASRPGFFNALPDFGLAAVFLVTWVMPNALGDHMVKWLLVVMLMEFIVIHSAAIMGTVAFGAGGRGKRGAAVLGLGGFYTLFAGGISFAFSSWWPITSFWGQTLNRLLGVLLGRGEDAEQKATVMRGWSVAVMLYVLGCLVTVVVPMPALGITPAVIAAQHIPGRGLWVEHPERVIAFGFLYYLLTAWSELGGHAWAKRPGGGGPSAAPPFK